MIKGIKKATTAEQRVTKYKQRQNSTRVSEI